MKKFTISFTAIVTTMLLLVGCTYFNNDRAVDRKNDRNNFDNVNFTTDRNNHTNDTKRNNVRDDMNFEHSNQGHVGRNDGSDFEPRNVRNDVDNHNGRNMTNTNQRDSRFDVADEAADRVADLKEVNRAYVVATDNNAYVAVILKDNKDHVSTKLEKDIANEVRKVDKDIDHVYVSTNPDFVERMRGYTDRFKRGEPIEGLFDEFSTTIKRVFPTKR